MAYIGSSPTKVVSRQSANIFTYTATANQTAFTGADANGNTLACSPSDIMVHMNGIKLEESDYTATTTTVTLGSGAAVGDEVTITAFLTFESADHYTKSAADTRYVNTSGDTMTGKLALTQANSNTPPFVIEAATEPNDFSVSGYSDANGAYYMLGANMYLNSGGNTATWESSENSAGILLDSRGTNGVEFSTGTGTGTVNLKVDGSGRVTMPNQPCFLANGNQGGWQTVSQGNTSTVAFHQEQFDQGNCYNNSTMRFVAPVAGKYLLHFSAYVRLESNDDDTNHAYTRIQKNGSNYAETFYIYGYVNNGDADQQTTITVIMDMAANDYAMCALSAASGSASYYQPGCQFMGYLVA